MIDVIFSIKWFLFALALGLFILFNFFTLKEGLIQVVLDFILSLFAFLIFIIGWLIIF